MNYDYLKRIKNIIKKANELDRQGKFKEADKMDKILFKIAETIKVAANNSNDSFLEIDGDTNYKYSYNGDGTFSAYKKVDSTQVPNVKLTKEKMLAAAIKDVAATQKINELTSANVAQSTQAQTTPRTEQQEYHAQYNDKKTSEDRRNKAKQYISSITGSQNILAFISVGGRYAEFYIPENPRQYYYINLLDLSRKIANDKDVDAVRNSIGSIKVENNKKLFDLNDMIKASMQAGAISQDQMALADFLIGSGGPIRKLYSEFLDAEGTQNNTQPASSSNTNSGNRQNPRIR